jgi:AraC family transcriptional regulator, regulatory protein of adaptative response / DNA-3-methyladenine glycosylase II
MIEDEERCYRAVQSRDARFDGWFFTAVTTTGIYCRPSCPAITPRRQNVRFYTTAAAAQQSGFRACKRCRPDASPGSPQWNERADLVGRAMRLIADGVVDRDGVPGLARRLNYSERHLNRQLTTELGAGPLALARAQRAHTARLLIETTELTFTQIAFASGFTSVRQFNDTVREVFCSSPSELRAGANGTRSATGVHPAGDGRTGLPGSITLRLAYREPFEPSTMFEFLGSRAVPGVESWDGVTYRRVLDLPHGLATVALAPAVGYVQCDLGIADWRDVGVAVQRCRRMLDLDADPVAIAGQLGYDALIGALVAAAPGRRSPGHVDGNEVAVRAVFGQQVSVAGARTLAGRLAVALGEPLPVPVGGLTHAFPRAEAIAAMNPADLAMPESRKRALLSLCEALAEGSVVIDPGVDRAQLVEQLVRLPGIGPWTAGYIAMRALGDPDVFLPTDLGVRHAVERLGGDGSPRALAALAERWRPWRSYALHHLWASLASSRASSLTPSSPLE